MATDAQSSRVLLVEDEFLLRHTIAEALLERGFEVHAVANAKDALDHLSCGAPCDILLTDINLTRGIDGTVLAQLARQLRPDLPVVYASGSARKLEQIEAVPGAIFVAKPYDPKRLCVILTEMTQARH
jgi:CheY-like chemotaxis protein